MWTAVYTVPVAMLLLGAALLGQAAIPSPGSQVNSAGASLYVSVNAPMVAGPLTILGPGSPSTTYAWTMIYVTCGPGGFPPCLMGGGALPTTASIIGGANMPVALGYSTRPAVPPPLPLGAYLMATLPTPSGILHLDLSPSASGYGVLLDGIGLGLNPALPASTNSLGVLSLPPGSLWLGSGALSGNPDLAFQALVANPISPTGYTLSAAFTTAHHQ